MISSACTSRKRSPTLIASRSRRLCRSVTSWTIFSSCSSIDPAIDRRAAVPASGRSVDMRRRARSTATSSRFRVDRLQQVVDRVDLERLDRVLIERGDEDDVRRRALVEHPPRHLEAGQPRHLHVEKHHVGLQPVDRRQRLDAVASLSDDLDAADLSEQVAQLVARQLLVVHDHSFRVRLSGRTQRWLRIARPPTTFFGRDNGSQGAPIIFANHRR